MGVERNGQAVPRLMNGRGELIPLRREGLSIEFVKPTPALWLDSFAIPARSPNRGRSWELHLTIQTSLTGYARHGPIVIKRDR
jgi:spermidine/putrescine-binding protein